VTEFEQNLQSVREVFVNYPKRYSHNEELLRNVDMEIQDILHAIELSNFNAYGGFKLSKELQKARQERRRIKEEMEMMEPIIKDFLNFVKPTEKNISITLGNVRKAVARQSNRCYSMRTRKDLQELVK
jgi:archaellum component FlaC